MIEDYIKKGKTLMLRCKVVDDYKSNCIVKVKLPNDEIGSFHLNNFLPPKDMKCYYRWEYK